MEGNEVTAELDFLNQQNIILNMENNALKHRLENLAQEQLIKYSKFLSLTLVELDNDHGSQTTNRFVNRRTNILNLD